MSAPYLLRWLDDPDGGGYWPQRRDQIRAHDPECGSLEHLWLPRRTGVSCLSDWMECDGCEITFAWEGLNVVFEDCPHSHHWRCSCCAAEAKTCGCKAAL